jgi:hypothetical protein
MSRTAKRLICPLDNLRSGTAYPASRKQVREDVLKEEEQLYLIGKARTMPDTADELQSASNRYHQNGASEKVLGAVYTPPRVAAA